MAVHHIPSHGGDYAKEPVKVPLVVYLDKDGKLLNGPEPGSERKVIGSAEVIEEKIRGTIGKEAQDILDIVYGAGDFRMSFGPPTFTPPNTPALFDVATFKMKLSAKVQAELDKMNDTAKDE